MKQLTGKLLYESNEKHPAGTLYVAGPAQYEQDICSELHDIYGDIPISPHRADGQVILALDVPFPDEDQANQLDLLVAWDWSGCWYPWNVEQPYNYDVKDERYVFGKLISSARLRNLVFDKVEAHFEKQEKGQIQ